MEDNSFLDRLHVEVNELQDKATKLKAFIGGDKFTEASQIQKRLLTMQLSTMHAYIGILELRLLDLENKN